MSNLFDALTTKPEKSSGDGGASNASVKSDASKKEGTSFFDTLLKQSNTQGAKQSADKIDTPITTQAQKVHQASQEDAHTQKDSQTKQTQIAQTKGTKQHSAQDIANSQTKNQSTQDPKIDKTTHNKATQSTSEVSKNTNILHQAQKAKLDQVKHSPEKNQKTTPEQQIQKSGNNHNNVVSSEDKTQTQKSNQVTKNQVSSAPDETQQVKSKSEQVSFKETSTQKTSQASVQTTQAHNKTNTDAANTPKSTLQNTQVGTQSKDITPNEQKSQAHTRAQTQAQTKQATQSTQASGEQSNNKQIPPQSKQEIKPHTQAQATNNSSFEQNKATAPVRTDTSEDTNKAASSTTKQAIEQNNQSNTQTVLNQDKQTSQSSNQEQSTQKTDPTTPLSKSEQSTTSEQSIQEKATQQAQQKSLFASLTQEQVPSEHQSKKTTAQSSMKEAIASWTQQNKSNKVNTEQSQEPIPKQNNQLDTKADKTTREQTVASSLQTAQAKSQHSAETGNNSTQNTQTANSAQELASTKNTQSSTDTHKPINEKVAQELARLIKDEKDASTQKLNLSRTDIEKLANAKESLDAKQFKAEVKEPLLESMYISSQKKSSQMASLQTVAAARSIAQNGKSVEDINKSAQMLKLNLQSSELSVQEQKEHQAIIQKSLDKLILAREVLDKQVNTQAETKASQMQQSQAQSTQSSPSTQTASQATPPQTPQASVEVNVSQTATQAIQTQIIGAKQAMSSMMSDVARTMYQNYKPPVTAFRMNLNPSGLGNINVLMRNDKERGGVSISMSISNTATLESFVDNQSSLRNALMRSFDDGSSFDLNFSQQEQNEHSNSDEQKRQSSQQADQTSQSETLESRHEDENSLDSQYM